VLRGEVGVEDLLARRRATHASSEGVAGPPKISLDNQLSDSSTVLEVKCPDRVGLLYVITRTLSAQGLDIRSARIATEIDQAYDTFYVTDRQGRRLEDEAAMAHVRESLEDALLKPL
jgi:[protein-PII] uridylyltransferase